MSGIIPVGSEPMTPYAPTRRSFLGDTATGLGGIALAHLLSQDKLLGKETKTPVRPEIDARQPNLPRKPHYAAKAKSVLVIFCSGVCSQVDTWDYKPELIKRDGQPMPGSEKLVTFQGEQGSLVKSPYPFRPRGQCGKMTSDRLLSGSYQELRDLEAEQKRASPKPARGGDYLPEFLK